STFWVALPAAGAADGDGADGAAEARAAAAGEVVAVVDDDPDVRAFAAEVLRLSGYRPVQDDGGPGVGARLAAARPGVVLLDLNLEGRDGTEALRELRAEPALAGVPVAAFTGSALPRDRERTRAAGFDDLLMKPVEPDALVERVAALLARAASPSPDPSPPGPPSPPPSSEGAEGAEGAEGDAAEEDDDYLAPLRARFRAGLPDRVRAMEEALEAVDGEALVREAHKLKGAAAGYGYDELAHLAAAAEGALRDGAPPTHPSVGEMMRGARELHAAEG
ncbi:MAG TPA: response regulator, partial [Longimicrobium sp.]|nr:response regulator [Longimicrobium sp.]